jgi:type I restriction enzyme R subunit
MPADAQAEAIKEIQRIFSPELLANNEAFQSLLTEGIPISKQVDGNEGGDRVWLIDFKNPYNNDFVVANQFTVVENNNNKRPDVILFVNGIPLVVIELKNAVDENATIHSAFRQIETYKTIIPTLFTYNGFVCNFRRIRSQSRFNLGRIKPFYGVEVSRWKGRSISFGKPVGNPDSGYVK